MVAPTIRTSAFLRTPFILENGGNSSPCVRILGALLEEPCCTTKAGLGFNKRWTINDKRARQLKPRCANPISDTP